MKAGLKKSLTTLMVAASLASVASLSPQQANAGIVLMATGLGLGLGIASVSVGAVAGLFSGMDQMGGSKPDAFDYIAGYGGLALIVLNTDGTINRDSLAAALSEKYPGLDQSAALQNLVADMK